MSKPYLKLILKRAIWRFNMTWHYLLAIAAILSLLVLTADISIKTALFGTLIAALGFMLMDVPYEHKSWRRQSGYRRRERSPATREKKIYQNLIEALPDPILILGAENELIAANQPARASFNIRRSGQDITTIIRSPDFLDALATLTSTGENVEFQLKQRVPLERHFTVRLNLIDQATGEENRNDGQQAIIVHFHDLTEQEQLDRMRSDFIANASHELRTPLASMLGFIDTLQGAAKNDIAAQERFLNIMASQGQRMTRLIDDLLSLSRIEMNAHRRPNQRVDVNRLLTNTIDILRPLAEAAGLTIDFKAPDEGYITIGNRDELAQVFQNLIHNAIKYGKRKGEENPVITVRLIEGASQKVAGQQLIIIEVEDQGIGIDPIHIPRLTERFYRVDVQQSKEKGGTGLGLAIAKHILNHHGGELKIRSRVGKGATFSVSLLRA